MTTTPDPPLIGYEPARPPGGVGAKLARVAAVYLFAWGVMSAARVVNVSFEWLLRFDYGVMPAHWAISVQAAAGAAVIIGLLVRTPRGRAVVVPAALIGALMELIAVGWQWGFYRGYGFGDGLTRAVYTVQLAAWLCGPLAATVYAASRLSGTRTSERALAVVLAFPAAALLIATATIWLPSGSQDLFAPPERDWGLIALATAFALMAALAAAATACWVRSGRRWLLWTALIASALIALVTAFGFARKAYTDVQLIVSMLDAGAPREAGRAALTLIGDLRALLLPGLAVAVLAAHLRAGRPADHLSADGSGDDA